MTYHLHKTKLPRMLRLLTRKAKGVIWQMLVSLQSFGVVFLNVARGGPTVLKALAS